jgi:putative thioredoxin
MSGFVRALVTSGECEQAREILDSLEEDFLIRPEMREAIAAVEIAEQAGAHSGEAASLQAAVEADPDNLQARQDLALALFADGNGREAMDVLLASLQRDPNWNEGAAKTQLLAFFEALGAPHPDVIKARRKLSTYLFS